ncbi:MAG: hypothetical protein ACYC8T_13440 [Myxococcaceae bacterium]
MQDRYAGDIGDFSKYALLRALSPGRRIGLCWYLTSGEGEANNDGNHLAYLGQPERFHKLEPKVFEVLAEYRRAVLRNEKTRSIAALEQLGLVPRATRYHRTEVPRRRAEREAWRQELVASMQGADLVMLDPDNGLEGQQLTHKAASFDELSALRSPGRTLVLYHHQTRMKGGAGAEVPYLAKRLAAHGHGGVEAIRFSPYSSRYYLLLDATPDLVARLDALARRWGEECVRFSA